MIFATSLICYRESSRPPRKLEMELCGCKQATAHAHLQFRCMCLNFKHTKNSNRSKKNPQRRKSNSNLLNNSQNSRNRSKLFRAEWYHRTKWAARKSQESHQYHGTSRTSGVRVSTLSCCLRVEQNDHLSQMSTDALQLLLPEASVRLHLLGCAPLGTCTCRMHLIEPVQLTDLDRLLIIYLDEPPP